LALIAVLVRTIVTAITDALAHAKPDVVESPTGE